MILNTVQNLYSDLRKKTEVEYCGPCPWCGGDDRFIVRTDTNSFFCRGCPRKGDEVQFLRDFKGMKYVEACEYLGQEPKGRRTSAPAAQECIWQPKQPKPGPGDKWQERCRQLIDNYVDMLHRNKPAKEWLRSERGLTDETIKAACLGWTHSDLWMDRADFGLEQVISKKTGKPKKAWIPAGLIIPYFSDGQLIRVRVRRNDPGDGDRYILLSGSDTRPMVWGADKKIFVIVESELDGLLIQQTAGDVVGVVAMGSAQARPDVFFDKILRGADLILNSLDADAAGAKEAWQFWRQTYHSDRWPCVAGKDPGEMRKAGVDVRAWVMAGIKAKKIEWCDPLKPDEKNISKPIDFNHAPQQTDASDQEQAPVLKIEKMTLCQHGQPCRYLYHQPPERAVCQYCKTIVWDLSECPKGYWWPMHETATD